MCGRFALYENAENVISAFSISNMNHPLLMSYNIAPTQSVSVVIARNNKRELCAMRWGLIPSWQTPQKPIRLNINARLETVDSLPTFKKAFQSRHCLILANGFFEWNRKTKQPYYIQTAKQEIFAMAGIWEHWNNDGVNVDSCCIITQNPNKKIEAIHDRMPAIVSPQNYEAWLNVDEKINIDYKNILQPLTENNTVFYPISTFVNSSKNNGVKCIEEI